MTLVLNDEEAGWLADAARPGLAMAMRVVSAAADFMGADHLIPITSAHIDGCLYHGDGGVYFAEKLVDGGGQVCVPATLNVGALDLLNPEIVKGDAHHRDMSRRLMDAHIALGCQATWTCAPYQAGHRPGVGEQVAWGESNAVAFVNSVLGARTNRYGDFLDICCAITGRAPAAGLHLDENRRAEVVLDVSGLSPALRSMEAFYPVLGTILGQAAGSSVAVISGLPPDVDEDRLKALGAAAASSGAVGLFHVAGVTPEAATVDDALQGEAPTETIIVTPEMVAVVRDNLGGATVGDLDCVALGSPHFSLAEIEALAALSDGLSFRVPVYICTGRHVMDIIEENGLRRTLVARGVTFVVDTCVVVTPILQEIDGLMMTNSGKFAHYARPNTGYTPVFGSLADCVASAAVGRIVRKEVTWR